MKIHNKIAILSRTMSQDPILKALAQSYFSNVRFNDSGLFLKGDGLIDFAKDAEGLIVALERIDSTIIEQLPRLKVISKFGVGLDNLDLDFLQKKNISLKVALGINKRSVSELALGFMISLLRKIPYYDHNIRMNIWKNERGSQLEGKTVGLLGFGHIGQDLAKLLSPFRVHLLAHDILDKSKEAKSLGVKLVSFLELLEQSDILSVHIPYHKKNHHILDETALRAMKRKSYLINTARGGLVDENALYKALEDHLQGAAFDVFSEEPPIGSRLIEHPHFISTPHIGGSSEESILAMGQAAITELHGVLKNTYALNL